MPSASPVGASESTLMGPEIRTSSRALVGGLAALPMVAKAQEWLPSTRSPAEQPSPEAGAEVLARPTATLDAAALAV